MKNGTEFSMFDDNGDEVVSSSACDGFAALMSDVGVVSVIEYAIDRKRRGDSVSFELRPILRWMESHPGRPSPQFREVMSHIEWIMKGCDLFPNARFGARKPL